MQRQEIEHRLRGLCRRLKFQVVAIDTHADANGICRLEREPALTPPPPAKDDRLPFASAPSPCVRELLSTGSHEQYNATLGIKTHPTAASCSKVNNLRDSSTRTKITDGTNTCAPASSRPVQ